MGGEFDLVIFDCDGVLVDSEPIANRVLAACLTEIGLPTSAEESMHRYMGLTWSACVERFEAALGRALPDGFEARYRAAVEPAFRAELRAVPGIEAVLDSLDIPYCVASSGPPVKMRVTLSTTGLAPRFEGRIFSAVEVARGKPFPDLFLHASARMGAAPTRCAVIEDSPVGVRAGVAAGMRVFGYAARTDPVELEAAGAHVFREMRALPELLARA